MENHAFKIKGFLECAYGLCKEIIIELKKFEKK